MKVALIGAAGQLGSALKRSAPTALEVVTYDRATLDVSDGTAVATVLGALRPHLIINAAGYTQVDRAESEPDLAFAANAHGPRNLATAAAALSARLIHVSTDYVFSGEQANPYAPEAVTAPLSTYGRSKLAGERAVLDRLGRNAAVVRTSWLYSSAGRNFVLTMLRRMRQAQPIPVVSDQVGAPTWTSSLARAIWVIAGRADVHGIQHWSDRGVATWYDFAIAVQEEALARGLIEAPVEICRISSAEYGAIAKRPRYSVLDVHETVKLLGIQPPHWRESLRSMLDELTQS